MPGGFCYETNILLYIRGETQHFVYGATDFISSHNLDRIVRKLVFFFTTRVRYFCLLFWGHEAQTGLINSSKYQQLKKGESKQGKEVGISRLKKFEILKLWRSIYNGQTMKSILLTLTTLAISSW